jgi:hypothetical protein
MQTDTIRLQAQEASGLLSNRNREIGNLLLSERSVVYITLLATLLAFRREHELEPLHDDLYAAVRGPLGGDGYTSDAFNQDTRATAQLGPHHRPFGKGALRGYKDTRRRKFRYRLTDDASAFLLWLEARHRDDLEPRDTDTRDLLSELIGTLRETVRLFNKTGAETLDYETARGVFYRLARMGDITDGVSQTLGDFNARLLGFAASRYDAPTARQILAGLDRFLKQFLNRIHTLRIEITPEISKLRQARLAARWQACLRPHGRRKPRGHSPDAHAPAAPRAHTRGSCRLLCGRGHARAALHARQRRRPPSLAQALHPSARDRAPQPPARRPARPHCRNRAARPRRGARRLLAVSARPGAA